MMDMYGIDLTDELDYVELADRVLIVNIDPQAYLHVWDSLKGSKNVRVIGTDLMAEHVQVYTLEYLDFVYSIEVHEVVGRRQDGIQPRKRIVRRFEKVGTYEVPEDYGEEATITPITDPEKLTRYYVTPGGSWPPKPPANGWGDW